MTTHYIPAFTERNGWRQRAACGQWARANEHANEPTCADCKAYVEAAAADTRTAEEVFGPDDESAPVVSTPDVDARREYEEAYEKRYGRRR